MASYPAVETATSVLLAKSQADELLDDVFINFPLFFVGLIFGYAALETAKSQFEVQHPVDQFNLKRFNQPQLIQLT